MHRVLVALLVAAFCGWPASGHADHDGGLVGHWQADGNVEDSAHDHDGTLQGGATYGPGVEGQAFSFDGVNDHVLISNDADLIMTTAMTAAAWIYPTGPGELNPHGGIIVNKEGEYEVARFRDGTIQWAFANSWPGWRWISSGFVAPQDQWTHVAVTYDLGLIKTYANGALVHTVAGSGTIGDSHPAAPDIGWDQFRIGGRYCCSGQNFDGRIDDVRLYNRALSAAEVAGLLNEAPDVSAAAPNPAALWPPNNKMVDISIEGVTDPDGDAVSIEITGISNDETGTDDAGGIGTDTAQVRAARDGGGDGRVYTIEFIATDGRGGSAEGSVEVTVPHDQGKGKKKGRGKLATGAEAASWGAIKESVK